MTNTTLDTRTALVIDVPTLREVLNSDRHVVLLDARHAPGEPSKRPEYEAGHLPGAYWVELSQDLSGAKAPGTGNNPLPQPEALQQTLRGFGIHHDSLVVVYGSGPGAAPARAWFTLRWAGVPEVRWLDGGLEAWVAAGGELSTEEPAPGQGSIEVDGGNLPTLTTEEAAELARTGVLLDARGAKQYEGGPAEEGKPAQGHIPGAISAPAGSVLDASGRLKPADELREYFAGLGVSPGVPVGVYCGGGVAATQLALALASIDVTAQVYVGSWSAWSADPTRPVATGNQPG